MYFKPQYLFFSCTLMFINETQIHVMFSWIDTPLGIPLPKKNYAEDWSVTDEDVSDE